MNNSEKSRHFQWNGTTLILRCNIQPNAPANAVVGLHDGKLKIRITAPPTDGKANQHLIKLLGLWFGVSKHNITIVRGHGSRQKTVSIEQPRQLPSEFLLSD